MDPNTVGTVLGVAVATFLTTVVTLWPITVARIKKAKREAKTEAVSAVATVKQEITDEQAESRSSVQHQIEALEEQNNQLKERLTSTDDLLIARLEMATALERRVDELERARAQDKMTISRLETQLKTQQAEITELRTKVDQLQRDNARLTQERDSGHKRERELEATVGKQQAEINDMQRRILVLETENAVLERLLNRLEVVKVKVSEDEPAQLPPGNGEGTT